MDKTIEIKKYSKHPEMEGDELKVTIMNSEKIKPRMRIAKGPRKPKQPRMTVAQLAMIVGQQGTKLDQLVLVVNNLAIEMRAWFAAINKEIVDIKVTLQRHEVILNKHTEILERHEEILMRHELIFARNNLK
jgi:hypothetical protein